MVVKAGTHTPGGEEGTMYGPVTRLRNTPDLDTHLAAWGSRSGGGPPRPGYLGQYAYRLPDDPDGLYLVGLFASRAAYLADAASPASAACAARLRALLPTPPERHDAGEIFTHRRG
jgi:hypothetical protein